MGTAALCLALMVSALKEPFYERQGVVVLPMRHYWSSNVYRIYGNPWELRRIVRRTNDLILSDWEEVATKEMFWVPHYSLACSLKRTYDETTSGEMTMAEYWYHHYLLEELDISVDYLPFLIEIPFVLEE